MDYVHIVPSVPRRIDGWPTRKTCALVPRRIDGWPTRKTCALYDVYS